MIPILRSCPLTTHLAMMTGVRRASTVPETARRSSSSLPWKVLSGVLLSINVGLLCFLYSRGPSLLPIRKDGELFHIRGKLPAGVEYGSAYLDGESHRRWFLGHFFPTDSPRHFDDISMKWSSNPRGTTNGEVGTNKVAHSIAILVRGKVQVEFPGANLTLSRLGDYVLWKPKVPHSWTALEDTIALSVRWPSLPNDQISASSF